MTTKEARDLAIKLFGPGGMALRYSSKLPLERYQVGVLRKVTPPPRFECEIVAQGATWEAAFAGAGAHILREREAFEQAQKATGIVGRVKKWLALPEEIAT